MLNDSNIDYIEKDLEKSGLLYEPLKEEIIDHICSAVEEKMTSGLKFADAYKQVKKQFGNTKRLQELQSDTIKSENFNSFTMVRNYLKTSVRNITKHKFFASINVVGLAISIAISILIFMYIKDELSYDKSFPDADRIYRVYSDHVFMENVFRAAVTPAPLAQAVLNDYPEVVEAGRFRNFGSMIFNIGDKNFKESNIAFADSTIVSIFGLKIINGAEKQLVQPGSIIISESASIKFFNTIEAAGKTIKDDAGTEYYITGVFEDIPPNSHIKKDVLISMSFNPDANNTIWLSNNYHTYIKLAESIDAKNLESKLSEMVTKYIGPQLFSMMNMTIEQAAESGTSAKFKLQPLKDIYLHSNLMVEIGRTSSYQYILVFSSIAIFILIIACINFMNLATARSSMRAKEVGVRKALGSFRSHLIKQFLTESILLTAISYILSLLLVWLILPSFNNLAEKNLQIPYGEAFFIPISILGVLFLGFVAGIYPSFVLSSFKPAQILKGKVEGIGSGRFLRSGLVIFQFTISILLIIGTLIIYKQMNFIQDKNIGFNKEHVLIINDSYLLGKQTETYRDILLTNPKIISSSLSGFLPISNSSRSDNTFFKDKNFDMENGVNMQFWRVDHNYIETMGFEMLDGRNFSEGSETDQTSIIINQEAAKRFGFDNPIGKEIILPHLDNSGQLDSITSIKIIGLVKDFNYNSLKETVGPLCLIKGRSFSNLSIRFNSQNVNEIIDYANTEWSKIDDSQPFTYTFLDEQFDLMYKSESKTGVLIAVFAITAIFIACLGLFALSAFTAERRIKEIGIRKVMGASVISIVLLLSKDMTKLVITSFILAVPLAIYGIDIWLNEFAYKIEPTMWNYAVAGLAALAVAFITISYQALKAANSKPSDTLKAE